MDTPPPHILARKQSERALEQSPNPESEGPDLWATLDETPPGVVMQSAQGETVRAEAPVDPFARGQAETQKTERGLLPPEGGAQAPSAWDDELWTEVVFEPPLITEALPQPALLPEPVAAEVPTPLLSPPPENTHLPKAMPVPEMPAEASEAEALADETASERAEGEIEVEEGLILESTEITAVTTRSEGWSMARPRADRIAALIDMLGREAAAGGGPRRAHILYAMGLVSAHLTEDFALAHHALSRAVEESPDQGAPLWALVELLVERGDHEEAMSLLVRRGGQPGALLRAGGLALSLEEEARATGMWAEGARGTHGAAPALALALLGARDHRQQAAEMLMRNAGGQRLRRLGILESLFALGTGHAQHVERQSHVEHLLEAVQSGPGTSAAVDWVVAHGGDPALVLTAANMGLAQCGPEGHAEVRGRWHARRMWALERMDRLDEALEAGRAAADLLPTDVYLLDRLNALAHRQGAHGLQRQILARLGTVAGAPQGQARAWYERGLIADHQLGLEEEAVDDFQRALTALPGFTPALAALGRLSVQQGRWSEIRARFDEELDLVEARIDQLSDDEAGRAEAHSMRAVASQRAFRVARLCEVELADPQSALAYDRRALRLSPDLDSAFVAVESALEAAEDWRGLVTLYEEALESLEGEAARGELLSRIVKLRALATEDDGATAKRCHQILEQPSTEHQVLVHAAEVFERLGHWPAAVEARWRAFGGEATLSRWVQGLYGACLQEVEGDPAGGAAEAHEMYQALVRAAPSSIMAYDGLIRTAIRLGRVGALTTLPAAELGPLSLMAADALLATERPHAAHELVSDALEGDAEGATAAWLRTVSIMLHMRHGDQQGALAQLEALPPAMHAALSPWVQGVPVASGFTESSGFIADIHAAGQGADTSDHALEALCTGLGASEKSQVVQSLGTPGLKAVAERPLFEIALEAALEAGQVEAAQEAMAARLAHADRQERQALWSKRLFLYEDAGDAEGIIEAAEACLALDPESVSPRLALFRLAQGRGDIVEMVRLGRGLVPVFPAAEGARLLGRLAAEAHTEGLPSATIRPLLAQAVDLDPELEPAWLALQSLMEAEQDWRGLIHLLQRRFDRAEDRTQARRGWLAQMARIYDERLHAPQEALALWSQWLDAHPDDVRGAWEAAQLADRAEAPHEATRWLAKVLGAAEGPLRVQAGRALAERLEASGEIAAARACMRAVLDTDEGAPVADWEHLIRLTAAEGDWPEVQALYGRLYRQCQVPQEQSRRAHALGELAERLQGDHRLAAGWFCRALTHDPSALSSAWRMFEALGALPEEAVPMAPVERAVRGAHELLLSRLWSAPMDAAVMASVVRIRRWTSTRWDGAEPLALAQTVLRWIESAGQGERAPSTFMLPMTPTRLDAEARAGLYPEAMGGPTRALFDALALVLVEVLAPTPPEGLVRLSMTEGGPWSMACRQACDRLDLAGVAPGLFKCGARPRALESTLTPEPALIIGAGRLLNAPGSRERFELARNLEGLRAHLVLLEQVGPQLIAEAAAVVIGALRPDLPWTATVALEGVSPRTIERLEIRAGLLPRRSRRVIQEAIEALDGAPPDFSALAQAARQGADRVAMVTTGDPLVALEAAADGPDLARFLVCGDYTHWRDQAPTAQEHAEEVRA
ncbi:MAG: hypothetical protein ACE366_19720 [Bradymonadia bacterium]